MSIFDELGLDDPNIIDPTEGLPAGQYRGHLYDCKTVVSKKDASKRQIVFTYKVSEGPAKGMTIQEYKSANPGDDPSTKGWLKARLKSLHFEKGQNPADLIGKPVVFKVTKNGQFSNVQEVVLLDANGGVVTSGADTLATAAASGSGSPDW